MIRSLICRRAGPYQHPLRHFRASSTSSRHAQRIRIGRTGRELDVDLFEPNAQRLDGASSRTSVLLYLSRGPLLDEAGADERILDVLCAELAATHILHVRYRLNHEQQYPQPVYDATAAFDWAVEHLLPERSVKRHGRAGHVGRIATCGELIGGSLATMLALTECRKGQAGISAAAVNNAVTDWTDLEVQSSPSRKSRKSSTQIDQEGSDISAALADARSQIFRLERDRLDAFASPVLFFRSAGLPDAPSASHYGSDDGSQTLHEDHSSVPDTDESQANDDAMPTRKTRYSYQFPSRTLMLDLPAFCISTGNSEPLRRQGLELVDQLRKSVIRQCRPRRRSSTAVHEHLIHDHEEDERGDEQAGRSNATDLAESRVTYTSSAGLGLWDDSAEGLASLQRSAQWLKVRLT